MSQIHQRNNSDNYTYLFGFNNWFGLMYLWQTKIQKQICCNAGVWQNPSAQTTDDKCGTVSRFWGVGNGETDRDSTLVGRSGKAKG